MAKNNWSKNWPLFEWPKKLAKKNRLLFEWPKKIGQKIGRYLNGQKNQPKKNQPLFVKIGLYLAFVVSGHKFCWLVKHSQRTIITSNKSIIKNPSGERRMLRK